jgi:hypothetical protein
MLKPLLGAAVLLMATAAFAQDPPGAAKLRAGGQHLFCAETWRTASLAGLDVGKHSDTNECVERDSTRQQQINFAAMAEIVARCMGHAQYAADPIAAAHACEADELAQRSGR